MLLPGEQEFCLKGINLISAETKNVSRWKRIVSLSLTWFLPAFAHLRGGCRLLASEGHYRLLRGRGGGDSRSIGRRPIGTKYVLISNIKHTKGLTEASLRSAFLASSPGSRYQFSAGTPPWCPLSRTSPSPFSSLNFPYSSKSSQ